MTFDEARKHAEQGFYIRRPYFEEGVYFYWSTVFCAVMGAKLSEGGHYENWIAKLFSHDTGSHVDDWEVIIPPGAIDEMLDGLVAEFQDDIGG